MACLDVAVVFEDDFFDDGKAESCAFFLASNIGFKGVFVKVNKACAVVFNGE